METNSRYQAVSLPEFKFSKMESECKRLGLSQVASHRWPLTGGLSQVAAGADTDTDGTWARRLGSPESPKAMLVPLWPGNAFSNVMVGISCMCQVQE